MQHTARTSPYYPSWVSDAPRLFADVKAAVLASDFERLAPAVEQSALMMHASMLAANPALIYFRPATLAVIEVVRAQRRSRSRCCFTIDAGPHVKVLVRAERGCGHATRAGRASTGVLRVLESDARPRRAGARRRRGGAGAVTRARAPGKVVLSGAYAVLAGAPAIVSAVSRYVTADTSRPADVRDRRSARPRSRPASKRPGSTRPSCAKAAASWASAPARRSWWPACSRSSRHARRDGSSRSSSLAVIARALARAPPGSGRRQRRRRRGQHASGGTFVYRLGAERRQQPRPCSCPPSSRSRSGRVPPRPPRASCWRPSRARPRARPRCTRVGWARRSWPPTTPRSASSAKTRARCIAALARPAACVVGPGQRSGRADRDARAGRARPARGGRGRRAAAGRRGRGRHRAVRRPRAFDADSARRPRKSRPSAARYLSCRRPALAPAEKSA